LLCAVYNSNLLEHFDRSVLGVPSVHVSRVQAINLFHTFLPFFSASWMRLGNTLCISDTASLL
jgi:hypothetical protein